MKNEDLLSDRFQLSIVNLIILTNSNFFKLFHHHLAAMVNLEINLYFLCAGNYIFHFLYKSLDKRLI